MKTQPPGGIRAQPTEGLEPAGVASAQVAPTLECWRHSGVFGDSTCPELSCYVHCRNCPAFANAGLLLLQRPPPPGYAIERAVHYSRPKRDPDSASILALFFRCYDAWLALPTSVLKEVTDRKPIHSLPFRDHGSLLGVANIRGELTLCFSLGRLLDLPGLPSPDHQRTQYQRLVVASFEDLVLAFPTHEVPELQRVNRSDLTPVGPVDKTACPLVSGRLDRDTRSIALLDPESLGRAASAHLA